MQASCANITNRSLIGSSVRHPKLHKTAFPFFLISGAIGIRHTLAVLMGRFSKGKVILVWKWNVQRHEDCCYDDVTKAMKICNLPNQQFHLRTGILTSQHFCAMCTVLSRNLLYMYIHVYMNTYV